MKADAEYSENMISIVMACFNGERFAKRAVLSVLGQSYEPVELIVVDDGSTDGSRDLLCDLAAESPVHMKVLHQSNKGPYPARNLGLRHVRGGFVGFLDADDFWDRDCLRKLHHALTRQKADLSYCGWQNFGDGAPGNQPYVPPRYEEEDAVAHFLRSCPWPIHAALVRRQVIEAVGGFSERYFSCMDYDLWLRVYALTKKIILVPEILAYYRWHSGGQISATKWKQVMDSWKVKKDFVCDHPSLVAHIPCELLRQMVDGCLLTSGYQAYWKRDLTSAHRLFRKVMMTGLWSRKDMKYLFPALLPLAAYRLLVSRAESLRRRASMFW